MKTIYLPCMLISICLAGCILPCDHTNLKGEIKCEEVELKVGQTMNMELVVPVELDGIYSVNWKGSPPDMGTIDDKVYDIPVLPTKEHSKEDRMARFTAQKAGKVEIQVTGFYKQTNPQPITAITLEIQE